MEHTIFHWTALYLKILRIWALFRELIEEMIWSSTKNLILFHLSESRFLRILIFVIYIM